MLALQVLVCCLKSLVLGLESAVPVLKLNGEKLSSARTCELEGSVTNLDELSLDVRAVDRLLDSGFELDDFFLENIALLLNRIEQTLRHSHVFEFLSRIVSIG